MVHMFDFVINRLFRSELVEWSHEWSGLCELCGLLLFSHVIQVHTVCHAV